MRKKFAAIMLIFALVLCGCDEEAEEAEPVETEGLVTTQYDL